MNILAKIIKGVRLTIHFIDLFMKKMRVEHYIEFTLALLSQGLVAIYALYIFSRLIPLQVEISSMRFRESFNNVVLDFNLVDFIYSLEPVWEFLSSFMVLFGIVWASGKFMRHAIGTVAPTIYERIKEIEEEMHGKGEEDNE